jgi:serine/threonine protein kinase
MSNSSSDALAPGQRVGGGRFILVRLLGKGGMGVVWLARDERLQEDAALKFLPAEIRSDAIALDDMRRETQRSRKLTHPNIIRIHDFFEAEGELPFISMEFVDGKNLNELRFERRNRLVTWPFLQPILHQLCEALEYAHGEKVIHRDLKPANMMLDSRGRLKLADFGIAAVLSDTMSRVSLRHATSGTSAYMSPQQMEGQAPRVTDDIYSLGASVYELLTSRAPFYTGDIVYQLRHVAPTPMDERLAQLELGNDIPAPVAAMVMACLAKEANLRPQRARAVAEWIGPPEQSEPSSFSQAAPAEISAPPPRAIEIAPEADSIDAPPSRSRLSPGMSWTLAAVSLFLLAGVGWWFWLHGRSPGNRTGVETRVAPSHAAETQVVGARPTPGGPEKVSVSAPTSVSNETGFQNLFNGRDLSGWDGDPRFWSVQNGCIVGETTSQHLPNGNTFLIWRDGEPGDFELRLKSRMTIGNSGIQFRSQSAGQWKITGYQAEIAAPGQLAWDVSFGGLATEPSPLLATCGEKVVYNAGGQKQITGNTGVTKEQAHAAFVPGGWNEYAIVAEGNHLVFKLNGLTTVDFTENRPGRALSGLVALQIHRNRGEGMRVEFKDIQIKWRQPQK